MISVDRLKDIGVNEKIINVLKKKKIKELYQHQYDALVSGLIDGESVIVNVPTAGGKTLIAEIAMVNKILSEGGKAVYLVPLRALAFEKFREFKKWKRIGLNVAISTGDFSSKAEDLENADIIVTTFEKFDSIMRHRANWIMDVKVLVVDEIHMLGESKRGVILENILIWAKDNMQVIGLSATVSNLDEIAQWLGAKIFRSSYRPVDLRKGVFCNGKLYWEDNVIEKKNEKNWFVLVKEIVEQGKDVLVFVNSRNQAERVAKKLANYLEGNVQVSESEVTDKVEERFGDMIYKGVAYHHGGLGSDERRWVENMFRRKKLKVVVATPTLAAGVNLPAWRVIIKNLVQVDKRFGFKWLDVIDVWQMMGRAGRPQYSKYGEAVIVIGKEYLVKDILRKYVYGQLEKVTSKMIISDVMYGQVLSLIISFAYRSVDEIAQHYEDSLFMHQFSVDELIKNKIQHIVDWLIEHGFVQEDVMSYGYSYEYGYDIEETYLEVTDIGKRVAELYIMPQTAVLFMNMFDKIEERRDDIAVFHLITTAPDFEGINAHKKEIEWLWKEAYHIFDRSYIEWKGIDDRNIRRILGQVKSALIIEDWINGIDEDEIVRRYGIGKGDLSKIIEYAEWLMYSLKELYKIERGENEVYEWLNDLTIRVKYGVPDEMLSLVKIKGIGRKKAKELYLKGIRSIEDLKKYGNAKLKELGLKQGTLDMMFGGGKNG